MWIYNIWIYEYKYIINVIIIYKNIIYVRVCVYDTHSINKNTKLFWKYPRRNDMLDASVYINVKNFELFQCYLDIGV